MLYKHKLELIQDNFIDFSGIDVVFYFKDLFNLFF